MFGIDGTLLQCGDFRGHPPAGGRGGAGADRAASERTRVVFTNGSLASSAAIAQARPDDSPYVTDDELLSPVESTAGEDDAGAVFVAHLNDGDLGMLKRAARASPLAAPTLHLQLHRPIRRSHDDLYFWIADTGRRVAGER